MATFKVKLGSSDGELMIRQVHGHNAEAVTRQFQGEGFFVFSVQPVLNFGSFFGVRKSVPAKQFLMFNKEFRGLIKAGLPIVEGLDILLARMPAGRLRTMLEDVRARLRSGESLSSAFQTYASMIPPYYPALIHAGEQSGDLPEVLERFIQQEERLRKVRKKFAQSLTYPVILLLVGMASMYIILTRAMPQFTAMYQNSGRELPLVTRIVISASDFLTAYYLPMFIGALVLLAIARLYSRSYSGKLFFEKMLRYVPVFGKMYHLQNQNVFNRTMRMLISGGIPVPEALAITRDAMPSVSFRESLRAAHLDLMQGHSLQQALEDHTHMDDLVCEMVRVGEATGTLSEMLEHVAEAGEEQAEDYLELISSTLAPVLLLLLGIVVAAMVIAMYLPMFGSYDSII